MKWEYFTARVPLGQELFSGPKANQQILTDRLNLIGEDHWELVSTFGTNHYHGGTKEIILVFKRPKNQT